MQTLFVSLAGMLLGKKRGVLSVLTYIGIGLLGLPIFTQGGGPSYVLQPSFGFLIGFVIYTWFTAQMTERIITPSIKNLLSAQLPGLFFMYAVALPYFYLISNFYLDSGMGVDVLMTVCFLWMMPGEALKCLLAAWLGKRLIPVMRRKNAAP